MVDADPFGRVSKAASHMKALLVVMAKVYASDNMLIPLMQGTESVKPVFARVFKQQLMTN